MSAIIPVIFYLEKLIFFRIHFSNYYFNRQSLAYYLFPLLYKLYNYFNNTLISILDTYSPYGTRTFPSLRQRPPSTDSNLSLSTNSLAFSADKSDYKMANGNVDRNRLENLLLLFPYYYPNMTFYHSKFYD